MKTDLKLKKVKYADLNSRQQEAYNFQKVSAILADYGFVTIKLTDDYNGADFLALHIDGERYVKIQLKGRLTFAKKYIKKEIYICFPYDSDWYLYNHDLLLEIFLERIHKTKSWDDKGLYSWKHLSIENKKIIEDFKL